MVLFAARSSEPKGVALRALRPLRLIRLGALPPAPRPCAPRIEVFSDNGGDLLHTSGTRRRAGLWRWSAAILLAAALVYALID